MNAEPTTEPTTEAQPLSAMEQAWQEYASDPINLELSRELAFMRGWVAGKLNALESLTAPKP